MTAVRKAGDFPDVDRLVITDDDGDRFIVDRYPSGGVIVAAARADGDDARAIPVRVAPADLAALVAFLTGGQS